MPVSGIITGQKVDKAKLKLAKDFRKHMTEEEQILWEYLRAGRLNGKHFRRQQVVDGFIVDFYCHSANLVIELDGPVHEKQKEYDADRSQILVDRGLRVIRIRNEEVFADLDDVLERIRRASEIET